MSVCVRSTLFAAWVPTLVLALLAAAPAHAQLFKDPALQVLYAGDRLGELETLARQRVTAQPTDAQAVLGLAMAALQTDEPTRRETLTVRMATSVGTVKESLQQALQLAPQWYPARSALVEFYLLAPAVLGGRSGRATEVARAAPRSEQVRALEARIALADDRPEAALAALQAVATADDPALAEDVASWTGTAAFALLAKGGAAQARPVFERLQRERPGLAIPAFGLGRAHTDLGALAEAVRWLEQAGRLKGAAALPIDYRLGLALLADGRTEPGGAALARYVAAGKGAGKSLDDAKKRLAQLGAAPG